MQTFVDRNSHPHRAAEARQFSLDATHPRVRTIQCEIAQRYEQLAAIPNDAPVGAFSLGDSPCDEARPTPASSRGAARWHEDRTVGPASPGGCDWENEGGAPRYAAPAREVTVMPNPPMFVALNDVELKRDIPTAGSNICAAPPDEERPADGKPHIPPVTSSAASLGTAADHHIDRHTGVAGIAIRRRWMMSRPTNPSFNHSTASRSAAEKAGSATSRNEQWENEGDHMAARAGHIVQTPGKDQPYKVILEHEDGTASEHACSTIREGEAIIRRNTPTPIARDTSRDRGPGNS